VILSVVQERRHDGEGVGSFTIFPELAWLEHRRGLHGRLGEEILDVARCVSDAARAQAVPVDGDGRALELVRYDVRRQWSIGDTCQARLRREQIARAGDDGGRRRGIVGPGELFAVGLPVRQP